MQRWSAEDPPLQIEAGRQARESAARRAEALPRPGRSSQRASAETKGGAAVPSASKSGCGRPADAICVRPRGADASGFRRRPKSGAQPFRETCRPGDGQGRPQAEMRGPNRPSGSGRGQIGRPLVHSCRRAEDAGAGGPRRALDHGSPDVPPPVPGSSPGASGVVIRSPGYPSAPHPPEPRARLPRHFADYHPRVPPSAPYATRSLSGERPCARQCLARVGVRLPADASAGTGITWPGGGRGSGRRSRRSCRRRRRCR